LFELEGFFDGEVLESETAGSPPLLPANSLLYALLSMTLLLFSVFFYPTIILFEGNSSFGLFFFIKNVETFVYACLDLGDITGMSSASLLMLILLLSGDSLIELSFQSNSLVLFGLSSSLWGVIFPF